jgi:pyruvate/2-oxoacid:ferredoxin oxidoreductase alpha subunit
MLDLTMEAFEIAFTYRNPVVVLGDGYLGQITGRVSLPTEMVEPGLPAWAVWGDEAHRGNLICSIALSEADLEAVNVRLNLKYAQMIEREQRADLHRCDDAEWLLVACNTPARMAKGAVEALRAEGIRAGLFRPVSLWPFPIHALAPLLELARGLVMVEAGPGQLEDELRLALSHEGIGPLLPVHRIQRYGGVLPQQQDIVDRVRRLAAGAPASDPVAA